MRHVSEKVAVFVDGLGQPVSRLVGAPIDPVGARAFDHRASVANAWRRRERGVAVAVCAGCACEVDVPAPVHSIRCRVQNVPSTRKEVIA